MPRLMNDDMDNHKVAGGGGFQFSAVRPDKLGATEYTLVTIIMDVSGSVDGFKDELLKTKKAIIEACQKSPRADNLLVRDVAFNHNVEELHGFKQLNEIDVNDYEPYYPNGTTYLYGATYSGVASTIEYGKLLVDQDFDVNGAVYIITDGLNNIDGVEPKDIKDLIMQSKKDEDGIESMITILVGLGDDTNVSRALTRFKDEANLTQFVDVGEATPGKLAKLAQFVSQSISSQSQSLGSGSASVPLNF